MAHSMAFLHPDEHTRPCIFDVNLAAVDPEREGWMRVSLRYVQLPGDQTYSAMKLSLSSALTHHPAHRVGVKGIPSYHFKKYELIPEWIRERIAVLNMAQLDMWVRGIGKRWCDTHSFAYGNKRYYTLEWNCEEKVPT